MLRLKILFFTMFIALFAAVYFYPIETGEHHVREIVATSQGYYLCKISIPMINYDGTLMLSRHDHAGNELWVAEIEHVNGYWPIMLQPAAGGGVLVAGTNEGHEKGNVYASTSFLAAYDRDGRRLFQAIEKGIVIALSPGRDDTVDLLSYTTGDLSLVLSRYNTCGERLGSRAFGRIYKPEGNDPVFNGGMDRRDNDCIYVIGKRGRSGAIFSYRDGREKWSTEVPIYPECFAAAPAGGFYLGGFGDGDGMLARYDSDGKQIWLTKIDVRDTSGITGLSLNERGEIFASGTEYRWEPRFNGGVGWKDPNVVKLSPDGGLIWYRQTGRCRFRGYTKVAAAEDGGCYLAGDVYDGLNKVMIARYDADGKMLWRIIPYRRWIVKPLFFILIMLASVVFSFVIRLLEKKKRGEAEEV